ncbi:MAG TPA: exodeoxyribonuclease VII large subunit [Candidatus Baltobacteraceae bacterium]|nr:exodeoxyribonuclease VII large subunit [Candidatus Baltobacteraceae bacterium]
MQELRSPSVVISVGEFAARLREVFRRVRAFEYIGITGEISQWNPRQNGVYFTIKDANAVLECFAYHNRAQRFPNVPLGTAVIAYGAVRVQERRSRYELLVDDLRLTGIGELYAQYEALKERFRLEGLFAIERKRRVPRFPRRVVLVSAKGKGAEDFETVMRERVPHVQVQFVETRVQGFAAEVEIAEALDRASKLAPDLIVLARGGGSFEDLFPFNLEPVVRAIARTSAPVVTGIGHTGDHHLADDVADLSCETPSNAAQHIANLWQRGNERLERLAAALDREMREVLVRSLQRADQVSDTLERALERFMGARRERLFGYERRLNAQNPAQRMAERMGRIATLRARLDAWPGRALERWRRETERHDALLVPAWERLAQRRSHALEVAATRLESADPNAPLARGYAMILREGRVVRGTEDVHAGDAVSARLGHGTLDARVEAVHPDE